MTGTDGKTVGSGVSGSVRVGTGVSVGVSVGVVVAEGATGVSEIDGDALDDGDDDGDVEGLVEGAATCCDEITAAPRSNSATSAIAAKTVNTVDHRSTCRRTGADAAGVVTCVSAGGRSSCSVASGSRDGGSCCTLPEIARAVPNGRTLERSAATRDEGWSRAGCRGARRRR